MIPDFAVTFFGALFAIMNPLVNLPLFLSLTAGYTPTSSAAPASRWSSTRRSCARRWRWWARRSSPSSASP